LTLNDALVQPIVSSGFNATSGATSLGSATTAGNTLLIAAATYGTTGISTPSGYTADQPTNVATQKVYFFRKSNIGASETLPTLSTGASTQKTVWFALELVGLELVAPKDVVSAIATATAQSLATATIGGAYYDCIGFCLHLAQNGSSTTPPTWSGQVAPWIEQAEQGQADATTSIGAALSAWAPQQTASLTGCSADSSLGANGPLAAVAVKYMVAGARSASDLRYFTGFEPGTTAGIATGVSGSRLFEAVSGSPTITTSTPRNGNYCLELPDTAVAHNLTWPNVPITVGSGGKSPSRVCFRFVGNLPTSDTEVCLLEPSGVVLDTVVRYRAASSKIGVQVGSNTEQLSAATIQADTWYALDLELDPGSSASAPHTVSWQLDGVEQTPATHTTNTSTLTGVVLRIGRTTAAAPGCLVRYDDCLIAGRRGNYPLGDHKVVLLTVDPAGTLSVIGSTANFNTFTANGTMSAWNATTARDAIDEVPPTIGASADGLAQVTTATNDSVKIPMTTYAAQAGEAIRGVRMLACGWAAGTQAKTLAFSGYSGSEAGHGTQLFALADPLFDNSTTTPAWCCRIFSPTDGWTQAKLDALEFRMGLSDDATPDVGIHAVYAEVAVQTASSQPMFGMAGDVQVTAAYDPLSGGILALTTATPEGKATTLHYEVSGTPTDVVVAAASSDTQVIGAPDVPTVGYVAIYPDPEGVADT
jgi:hypothetical protein